MRAFADTSFLCALYRKQETSERVFRFMERSVDEVVVSSLVLWEFKQSLRFQVFRYHQDRTKGFSKREADRVLDALEENLRASALTLESVEWANVHVVAEVLSAKHTMAEGHRSMDILHLATAKHLRMNRFLTLDANQKRLAEAERLVVPL